MIKIKTDHEIAIMHEGGKILRRVIDEVMSRAVPGSTTKELDDLAEKLILENGAEPAFKKVKDYFWTLCVPIDDEIVHTPPSDRILKQGDLLTVDIGVLYKGYNTDYATSIVVGGCADEKLTKFLEVGKETLEKAIKQAVVGNRIGDISACIQSEIENAKYCIIRQLTGHGIGKRLHEDPYVFGYVNKPREQTPKIENGMCLAIEIIYSFTSTEIKYLDGVEWTIVTHDGSRSACFEKTIAIQKNSPFILT